jgi:hypothetical protein
MTSTASLVATAAAAPGPSSSSSSSLPSPSRAPISRSSDPTQNHAPPLDFSFKNVAVMEDLVQMEPRGGYRVERPPPPESQEEKKRIVDMDYNPELIRRLAAVVMRGDGIAEWDEEEAAKKKRAGEQRRERPQPKGVGDATALKLNNNELRGLHGWSQVLPTLLPHPERLAMLDLSFNNLAALDPVLTRYPITVLYLHANRISEIAEVERLKGLQLKTLTLHGNPVEKIPHYRDIVLSIFPTLKTLDFSAITTRDRDRAAHINIARAKKRKSPQAK